MKAILVIVTTIFLTLISCSMVTAADNSDIIQNESNQSLVNNQTQLSVTNNETSDMKDQELSDPKVYHNGALVYSTTNLQDAVDHSVDGDEIVVEPGSYGQTTVNKRVTIIASDPGANVAGFIITGLSQFIGTNWLEINGFTITSTTGSGIQLLNVEGCKILNNSIINNHGDGVFLGGPGPSNNNYITGNIIKNNLGSGISIGRSLNNTISGNTIENNTDAGIRLDNSTGNTIHESNIITNNQLNGIYLRNSSFNNTISGNTISTNFGSGIRAEDISSCIITNNMISGNQIGQRTPCIGGIFLGSSNNIIIGNTINENQGDGIRLPVSSNNTIYNNTIMNNMAGIHLMLGASNNTITANNITFNLNDGIYLEESRNNTINGNYITHNGNNGIFMDTGGLPGPESTPTDYNQITGNTIQDNVQDGIHVAIASNNTIIENIVSNNGGNGIIVNGYRNSGPIGPGPTPSLVPGPRGASFNWIIANIVQNNTLDGIRLEVASNNTISENTVLSNGGAGVILELMLPPGPEPMPECIFNEIKGNDIMNNTRDGIAIFSNANNNTIFENTIMGNLENGIYFNAAPHNGNTVHFNRIIPVVGKFAVKKDSPEPVSAEYNWWGSNSPDFATLISGMINYTPWLVMRFSANPTIIQQGQTSSLVADFRYDSDGVFHDPEQGHLPDGSLVTFTTDSGKVYTESSGSVNSKSVIVGTINGVSTAILDGDALVSANLDNQTSTTTVTINTATANAASSINRTIGMQETGLPIAGLVLAIFAVLGGLVIPKRK